MSSSHYLSVWRRANYEAIEAAQHPIIWLDGNLTEPNQFPVHEALAQWHLQVYRSSDSAFLYRGDGLGWLLASQAVESPARRTRGLSRDSSFPGVIWCGDSHGIAVATLNTYADPAMVNGQVQGEVPDPPSLQVAWSEPTVEDRSVILDSTRIPLWSRRWTSKHDSGSNPMGMWTIGLWPIVIIIWLVSNLVRFMAGQ